MAHNQDNANKSVYSNSFSEAKEKKLIWINYGTVFETHFT